MNPAKRALFGLAQSAGYTVIPTWRLLTYPQASYMRKLFGFLDIDLVIDVGANSGQYFSFLRDEVGYKGKVLSFEPIPRLVAEMRTRADAEWQIEAYALGAADGEAEFNVMAGSQFSSVLAPAHVAPKLFKEVNQVVERISVKVRTLDSLSRELDLLKQAKSVYLKLDTQGFDLEVLKGATSTLAKVAAVQSELSIRQIYEGAPAYDEAIRFIQSLGFVLSGMYPNNAGHFPMLVEFDGHFVSDRLVPETHKA